MTTPYREIRFLFTIAFLTFSFAASYGKVGRNEELASTFKYDQPRLLEQTAEPYIMIDSPADPAGNPSADGQQVLKQEKQQDDAEINKLQSDETSLKSKEAQAIAELKAGRFCSQCGRTASEIEASGESFEQHLKDVDGHIVPADPARIAAKQKEFDDEIASDQEQIDELRQREQDAQDEANREAAAAAAAAQAAKEEAARQAQAAAEAAQKAKEQRLQDKIQTNEQEAEQIAATHQQNETKAEQHNQEVISNSMHSVEQMGQAGDDMARQNEQLNAQKQVQISQSFNTDAAVAKQDVKNAPNYGDEEDDKPQTPALPNSNLSKTTGDTKISTPPTVSHSDQTVIDNLMTNDKTNKPDEIESISIQAKQQIPNPALVDGPIEQFPSNQSIKFVATAVVAVSTAPATPILGTIATVSTIGAAGYEWWNGGKDAASGTMGLVSTFSGGYGLASCLEPSGNPYIYATKCVVSVAGASFSTADNISLIGTGKSLSSTQIGPVMPTIELINTSFDYNSTPWYTTFGRTVNSGNDLRESLQEQKKDAK